MPAEMLLIAIVFGIAAGLHFFVFEKRPCTCPECRPDLYEPQTPEEYDERAAISRARTRYLDSEIERKVKEAEYADVVKLVDDMRRNRNV